MLHPVVPRLDTGQALSMPDPEVPERPVRRRFGAEYKLRIVEEANAATEPGQIGALLRREGLYSSHLVDWRRLYRAGALSALARPKGRPRKKDPLTDEVERLRRRNARLEARLATAERIIEIQGKVSELLGIPLSQASEDVESGS